MDEHNENQDVRLSELVSRIKLASKTAQAANDESTTDFREIERLVDTLSALYGSQAVQKAIEMEREASDKLYARSVRVALERRNQK